MDSSVVQAAYLLHLADDDRRASQFFRHAAEGKPAETRAALAQMAIDLGRPQIGIRIAKDAAGGRDRSSPTSTIRCMPWPSEDWPVPTEFAMAIARQESELDAAAASSVGARGLMQLMPATAKHMAERGGRRLRARRGSADDPLYNARLGTEYLARMLDALRRLLRARHRRLQRRAGAGGPVAGGERRPADGRASTRWCWIEAIPFTETRNYVMRVLEALHVYRARLKGRGGAGPARRRHQPDRDRARRA